MRLEDIRPGLYIRGAIDGEIVTVLHVRWLGSQIRGITCRNREGRTGDAFLIRSDEQNIKRVTGFQDRQQIVPVDLSQMVPDPGRIGVIYRLLPVPTRRGTVAPLESNPSTTGILSIFRPTTNYFRLYRPEMRI